MSPHVAVIVPTWNRRADVLGCVATLLTLDYGNYSVIVVDNGSVDGSAEALAECFGDSITVLRNDKNEGYAGGNNRGIAWACEHGADYVCLVNNDAEVKPDFLSLLVDLGESDPSIGAIGCRNIELDKASTLWGAYGVLTYGPFVVRMAGQGSADSEEWRVLRDVDWVIGNGSLWRCRLIEEIGMLDEDFFAYHDDVDWSVRFRRAGYRVVYAGYVSIMHRGGGTSDPQREHVFPLPYYLGRNGVLFVRKHARPLEKLRYAFWSGLAMFARWLRALLCRILPGLSEYDRNGHRYWDWEVSYARGVIDGLRGAPANTEWTKTA